MEKLRLSEVICLLSHFGKVAELGPDSIPVSGLPHSRLYWSGAVRVNSQKARDGASPGRAGAKGPAPPTLPRQWVEAAGGRLERPICRHSGLGEIAHFISAESSRVYSHPGQQGGWCPFLEGVQ